MVLNKTKHKIKSNAPHFPVDERFPTSLEIQKSNYLRKYLERLNIYESTEETCYKQYIIDRVTKIIKLWIKQACSIEGINSSSTSRIESKLFSFGSYRLGVHGPGSDVDTVCVGPRHISRSKYFFGKEPHCLEYILRELNEVTKVVSLPHAYVPLLKFTFSGISFDLLYANLLSEAIGKDFNLTDDSILKGLDACTVRSLNGCRVTEALLELVPNSDAFNLSLKFIKEWANWRGLNSNVMGYFGGINWAICMTYVNILFPNVSAATLIQKFFHTLRSFPWPQPLYLCEIKSEHRCLSVTTHTHRQSWNKWKHMQNVISRNPRTEPMPIITPAYPYINSAWAINLTTKEILIDEFFAAEKICHQILTADISLPTKWHQLLVPYPLFDIFKNFLLIDLSASQYETLNIWSGYARAKLRLLTHEVQPYVKVRLWPKAFEKCYSKDRNMITYFLGVSVRRKIINLATLISRQRDKDFKKINLKRPIERFKELIKKSALGKENHVKFQIRRFEKNSTFYRLKNSNDKNMATQISLHNIKNHAVGIKLDRKKDEINDKHRNIETCVDLEINVLSSGENVSEYE